MTEAPRDRDEAWLRRVADAWHPSAEEVDDVDGAMRQLDRSEVARQLEHDELATSLDDARIEEIVANATRAASPAPRARRRRLIPIAGVLALAAAGVCFVLHTPSTDDAPRSKDPQVAATTVAAEVVQPAPAPTIEAALPLLAEAAIDRNHWMLAISQVETGCGRAIALLSELRREGEASDACSRAATRICARLAEGVSLRNAFPTGNEQPRVEQLPMTLVTSLTDAADRDLPDDRRITAMLHLEHTIDAGLRALVGAAPQTATERTIRDFCLERLGAELVSLSPQ